MNSPHGNMNNPASEPQVVFDIQALSKRYGMGKAEIHALRGVDLQLYQAELVVVLGPSGSGKSTLLNLIGCIDTPTSGRILIDGQDVSGKTPDQLADLRARTIGFIFQTFNLLPVLSAAENVEYPLLQFPELSKAERIERVIHFLDVVKLRKYGMHRPNQLSGGQRQRVAIARALAIAPKIVLADEPTANLDHRTGDAILGLMKDINREFGTTFIFSTHDKKVMAKADRLVRIEDGQIGLLGIRSPNEKWVVVNERRKREKRA
jgi:putative ABC transport system ATP-binding protein